MCCSSCYLTDEILQVFGFRFVSYDHLYSLLICGSSYVQWGVQVASVSVGLPVIPKPLRNFPFCQKVKPADVQLLLFLRLLPGQPYLVLYEFPTVSCLRLTIYRIHHHQIPATPFISHNMALRHHQKTSIRVASALLVLYLISKRLAAPVSRGLLLYILGLPIAARLF
jgi:hypothetical protein